VQEFWRWVRGHTKGRKGRPDFYEAAGRGAEKRKG
jgi:hypothetical protein